LRQAARKSIGQALAELTAEFPDEDIKESKLRFLEAEGLVEPERTPSGYRKYSTKDMERLRYIIRAQREHYLPLKVIKEHLDAMDRGLEPPALNGSPTVPAGVFGETSAAAELLRSDRGDIRMSRRELVKTAANQASQESKRRPRYRSLTIRRPLRKLPYSKIDRPFTPIAAGVVFQVQRNSPIVQLAAKPLYEDRYPRSLALASQGSSPFEVKWSRACTGFTAINHPLQPPGEVAQTYRC